MTDHTAIQETDEMKAQWAKHIKQGASNRQGRGDEMSIEAMKQALEWIDAQPESRMIRAGVICAALRQAIEQAEKQEPVGEIIESSFFDKKNKLTHFYEAQPPVGTKLYTAPPKRERVGLTQEDRDDLLNYATTIPSRIVDRTEAKLKEKNDGSV